MKKDQQKLIGIIVIILIALGLIYSALEGKEEIHDEVNEEAVEEVMEEATEENTETEASAKVTTPATSTSEPVATTPRYEGCTPALSGQKSTQPKGIRISWSACDDADFEVFQVVRSNTSTNPTYPGDFVVYSSGNSGSASFVDTKVITAKTYHYRICAIKQQATQRCSSVFSISN